MKRAIAAALMIVSMVSPWGMRAAKADTPSAPAKQAGSNQLLKRALDRPLPEVRFSGSSFSDCIDFLSDATSVNIVVDWKALESAKVTKDTPITLRLSGSVRLGKVLSLILNQAAGADVLTYYVDEGVLQITTQEQADKELITRLYPIQDLLFQAPDYNNAPSLMLPQGNSGTAGGSGGGGGGGSSQGLFGGTSSGDGNSAASTMTPQQRADEIIKLITDTVRPEIWRVNGGNATISYIRGNLVVTAPRSVHEMLSSQ
jgi:uncharacterized membrane protein YgcG